MATNAGKKAGEKARSALKDARGELEVAAKFAWAKFAWYDQEEQSGESGFSSVSSARNGTSWVAIGAPASTSAMT